MVTNRLVSGLIACITGYSKSYSSIQEVLMPVRTDNDCPVKAVPQSRGFSTPNRPTCYQPAPISAGALDVCICKKRPSYTDLRPYSVQDRRTASSNFWRKLPVPNFCQRLGVLQTGEHDDILLAEPF